MIRLECDYAGGAHERVLRRLFETNLEQTPGYGADAYCAQARARIRACVRTRPWTSTFSWGAPRPTPR